MSLAVQEIGPGTVQAVEEDAGGERYTDMANAARLALEGGGQIVHADEMRGQRWFIFDGARLCDEPKTAVIPVVKTIAHRLYAEASEMLEAVETRRDGLVANTGNLTADARRAEIQAIEELASRAKEKFLGARRLESRDGCYAAIDLAQAEPGLRIKMRDLDAHPTWLNTPSGTLDLVTGELHAHCFTDYLTKITGAAYDPKATCPTWEAFLTEVLPDPEVRAFMQRSIGYALTDLTSEQCLWFLYGTGRNGKTTFINTIRRVIGDYAASTQASTLMVKAKGDDKRNDIAILRGARFVSATEAEQGQQMAEALIKQITGQDPVTARLMYAEFFTFVPSFKIMLAANHKPQIKGQDLGIWRRIHLVPFTVTVPEDRVDPDLPAALAAGASGILNWALEGFREWRKGGLRPPEAVRAATAAYKREMDPLIEFFEECVVVNPAARAKAADLYQAYQRWALRSGVKFTLTAKMLGQALEERGFQTARGHGGAREWRGLALRSG